MASMWSLQQDCHARYNETIQKCQLIRNKDLPKYLFYKFPSFVADSDHIAVHLKTGGHPVITHKDYNDQYMVDTR